MHALPGFSVPPRQAPGNGMGALPGGTAASVTSDASHGGVHSNKDAHRLAPAHASNRPPIRGQTNNPETKHNPPPGKVE